MPSRQLSGAIARAVVHPRADRTDAQLLEHFAHERDAAAFTELVRRHGPMVLGVCRRTLGNTPDADDAFQAVWLVLVRKAASITPAGMVGNWLYGVATRTAVHVRGKRFQRSAKQSELPDVADPRPDPAEANELAAAFDAELDNLPTKFRAAVVLCELEGRSLKDAAAELGVPMGTVASRLARGRAMLADRLRSRGFAASALTALLVGATAPVSARQCETAMTLAIAPQEVAGTVTEFAQGVLSAMLVHKLRTMTRVTVAILVLVGAVGLAAWNAPAQPEPPIRADEPLTGRVHPRDPIAQKVEEDQLWASLLHDEPEASRAVLRLAAMPDTALKIFQERLVPLKADKDKIRKLITDLDSDKEPVWKAAMESLSYLDPFLVFRPEEVLKEAKTVPGQRRLAAVLVQYAPDLVTFPGGTIRVRSIGGNRFSLVVSEIGRAVRTNETTFGLEHDVKGIRRPTWIRATRAIAILEIQRTPEAMKLLREMVTGHPDALPTLTAKAVVTRFTAPTP